MELLLLMRCESCARPIPSSPDATGREVCAFCGGRAVEECRVCGGKGYTVACGPPGTVRVTCRCVREREAA